MLLLLTLIVFGVGAYELNIIPIKNNSTSTQPALSPTRAKKFDYEIDYTNDGFKPNILKINFGQKVAFKNLTTTLMWPASDPHPNHTDYPQFDADFDYPNDGVYIFQFEKLGTFGYHNHNKSIDRGFIQVVDPNKPVPDIDKTKLSQRATRDKFLETLKPGDPASVYKLMDIIQKHSSIKLDCHDMAHDFGHRAYELYGFSGAMTFNDPGKLSNVDTDDICAGGYMHGILEEVFLNQPDLKNNPNSICINVSTNNRDSCFHGVGHGLMFVNERNISDSLTICKNLPDVIYQRRCYEGVFMEMFWGNTNHAGADSLGWDINQPLATCQTADTDQKPDCFLYAHLGYLRKHPKDFTGAINFCTKNGLTVWDKRYCLRGVGITLMKHFTSHQLNETEDLVAELDALDKYAYYQGVIGYSRLSSVSESDLNSFCNLLKTDSLICSEVLAKKPK